VKRLFVTATGTEVGKTWVTRGLALALRARGQDVLALKPFETGVVDGRARDAADLERASRPSSASFYRVPPPLAPYAATLEGHEAPDLDAIAKELAAARADVVLAEGAGGIAVPLSAEDDVRDFLRRLEWPVLLVTKDALGVLSHTLTAVSYGAGLEIAAVVLVRHDQARSQTTNRRILEERIAPPVGVIASNDGRDDAVRDAVERSGLVEIVLESRSA